MKSATLILIFLTSILPGCATTAPQSPATSASVPSAQRWYLQIDATPDPMVKKARELGELGEPIPKDLTVREAAHGFLLRTDTFAGSAVGYAGEAPGQVRALRTLVAQPDAIDAMEDLVRRAQPAGQLYGLCGLYLKDRQRFDKLIGSYQRDQRRVLTLFGCRGGSATVNGLAADMANGAFPREFQAATAPCRPGCAR